jgi:PAS domain-containing protein
VNLDQRQSGEVTGDDLVQLALLGEAIACAVAVAGFVWNDDRDYVAVNDYACELVGLSREELLATRVGDQTAGRASPLLDEVQRTPVSSGSLTLTRADGAEVPIAWVTFETSIAGLRYMASLCWKAR